MIAKEQNFCCLSNAVMVCVFLLPSQINEGKELVKRKMASSILLKRDKHKNLENSKW